MIIQSEQVSKPYGDPVLDHLAYFIPVPCTAQRLAAEHNFLGPYSLASLKILASLRLRIIHGLFSHS